VSKLARNKFRIDILGASLEIAADEDVSYLANIMRCYQIAVDNTKKMTGLQDNLKLAVVTGFLLCDELQKLQQAQAAVSSAEENAASEAERITQNLIERLDKALDHEASV
jgi:cell division protein ZapA (FtsZ GTPase activity inhibitor)